MSLFTDPSYMISHLRERWAQLPDHRKPNNNTRYSLAEAAMSAFAVFFLQSPSFLAHQRAMQTQKGRNNARTLFGVQRLPSDNQVRNLLDRLPPEQWAEDFWWVFDQLHQAGALEAFRDIEQTYLMAMDGVTYFSSARISCDNCSHREMQPGEKRYSHSAITPVLVKLGCAQVI